MDKPKVLMAIGGHVGDAELSSGGVLATMALKNWKVVTVALTGGERGNPPGQAVEEYRKQKEEEANSFAQMLGGEALVLPYVDGELPANGQVAMELCDLIRKYQPAALLAHWKNSIHRDHEAASRLVKEAQFLAGLASLERPCKAHFAKGPYYAQNWEDREGFQPYIYVEVTEEGFQLWEKAMGTHWFALHSPSFPYLEYYASLMRCNGILARKKYAEAFDVDPEEKKLVWTEFA